MQGFNRVFIMGNLGAVPEVRQSQGGDPYTRLSISNHYMDNEEVQHTRWFNVMVWGSQAENAAKYLTKGSGVMVEAYLDNYTRETESGGTEKRLSLKAKSLQFLPRSQAPLGKD